MEVGDENTWFTECLQKIKARKKTNNKWFEIQDSISYWDKYAEPVPQSDAKGKVHFRNNTVPKPR